MIRPLGKVVIPKNAKEVLLLFLPASKKSPLPCRILAVNFDPSKFANGQYLFVNLSTEPVTGNFGGKKLTIPLGKQVRYRPPAHLKEGTSYNVSLKSQINGVWRPLFKGKWVKNNKVKKLGIIYRDPKTQRLRLLCFPWRHDPRDFKP